MLRVFEAFSGYGSQSLALERLGIEHKVVGISEIDENAIKAYYALHTKSIKNYGDISQISPKDLPKFDLFTYSFPCQSLSLSGKLEGLERGKTRSGLLYECEKIIEYCRPKYLLMENVKSLVGNKFKGKFDEWLKYLESLGYKNQWFILNARDFDVPQNRERVFCVSILGEQPCLMFPKLCCVHSLFDYLEHSVDEKYIKEFRKDLVDVFSNGAYRGRYDENGKIFQKLELRNDGVSNTITTVAKDNVVVINGVVRYLTERECGRLMGLTDNEIFKIFESGISKSKLYKLFGNSIVIPCLMGIFKAWFID